MADWGSLIGAGSTAVVGIAGIVAAYKAGSRQQEATLQVARLQVESQERLVREERHQARLEKAYMPLLQYLSSEQADQSLTLEDVLRQACPTENVMYLASCASGAVRGAFDQWRSEPDTLARQALVAGIHAQVRRELLIIDNAESVLPYVIDRRDAARPGTRRIRGDDTESIVPEQG
ncbi:hypothetical protein [Streptomyces hawaiiensis]|jgi:hypothetical protein|uniref:hypothetical protein n=1 Tax=Streptomyces hawaiiensis TaxID=67305 RepID=UPI00365EBA7F